MQLPTNPPALDFTATTFDGKPFRLSDYQFSPILLTFLRNGACALCNLRVHELKKRKAEFDALGIKIVAVFESSPEDMAPYVGQQQAPFPLLSDPAGILYQLYEVENSPEKVQQVIEKGLAEHQMAEAAAAGFALIKQENSNFFRMPADFLIDRHFTIQKAHYSNFVVDHFPIDEVLGAVRQPPMGQVG